MNKEAVKVIKEWLPELELMARYNTSSIDYQRYKALNTAIEALERDQKTGHCKDCKYFEYDSVAKVDGIPLIVAHEICSRWGDGCKVKEDGYCFMYVPKEG